VSTLERMRRVFILPLTAALFVYHINHTWPQAAVLWLKLPVDKLARSFTNSDGLYILLRGITAIFITTNTLAFVVNQAFPGDGGTYG
jgi:hypothetical protein